jgi:hypothetical protein
MFSGALHLMASEFDFHIRSIVMADGLLRYGATRQQQ